MMKRRLRTLIRNARSSSNARVVRRQLGFLTVAGDGRNEDVLRAATVDRAQIVVICVAIDEVAVAISHQARELNPDAQIIVRCRYAQNITALERAGANTVISEEARSTRDLIAIVEQLDGAADVEEEGATSL